MIKRRIVFDVDDTMWDLNRIVCLKTNIDINKIKNYRISKNRELTDSEKEVLLKEYGDEENFKSIRWYKGVDKIFHLEGVNVEIYINSLSCNEQIRDLKYKQLKSIFAVDDSRLSLGVVDVNSVKRVGDVYILVDDSPYNIINTNAEYYIMYKTPWNTSTEAIEMMKEVKGEIIYCDTFEEIYSTCERLIKAERD